MKKTGINAFPWLMGLLLLVPMACGGGGGTSSRLVGTSCEPEPASSLSVSVLSYGAAGDGKTDDTAAIQSAINYVNGKGGGTVNVPNGTYLIDVADSTLYLRSNVTLKLADGAVLQAITTSKPNYHIITVQSATNANLVGGTIRGERYSHTGTTGEWGHGVVIVGSSNVVIANVMVRDCWGDGFYIGANAGSTSSNILICGVTADSNRRQGMSITNANGVLVRGSTFKNTYGTLPEAGLDIEPNSGETCSDINISGCTFYKNAGDGLACGVPIALTGDAWVTGVVIDGNVFDQNALTPIDGSIRDAIEISNCNGTQVTDNRITGTRGTGIFLRSAANYSLCKGNTVTGTVASVGAPSSSGDGIYEKSCTGNTITGNTSKNNARYGIFSQSCTSSSISGNTCSGNGVKDLLVE